MDIVHDYFVGDLKSTRLNSSHMSISYAVFCLKKKTLHAASRAVRSAREGRELNEQTVGSQLVGGLVVAARIVRQIHKISLLAAPTSAAALSVMHEAASQALRFAGLA